MVKKIASIVGAGALLLAMAGPAFGWWMGSWDVAVVKNRANATAVSGMNSQSNIAIVTYGGGVTVNGAGGARTMYTGNANADAGALVVANTHVGCGWCASGGWMHKDIALVDNKADAGASSGNNWQDDMAQVTYGGGVKVNGGSGTRYMNTGRADAESHAWTIVNTHLSIH